MTAGGRGRRVKWRIKMSRAEEQSGGQKNPKMTWELSGGDERPSLTSDETHKNSHPIRTEH